jgi:hypothetical protein
MKKILFIILTAIFAFGAQAQTLRTTYFMDNYANRHQRNPALSPSTGYVNFPALGNFYFGLETNMKLSDYLYPVGPKNDRQLGTFMHPDISSKQFLKKIGKRGETLGLDVNWNILGFGFYTKENNFWSADLNVKIHGGMNIPKDFFAFFKEMDLSDGHEYNWKDLNVAARAYAEFAFGHARDIEILGHDFRLGAKLKLLSGVADFRAKVNEMSLYTSKEKWKFHADADVSLLSSFAKFQKDEDGSFDGIETLEDFAISDLINLGGNDGVGKSP